MFRRTLVQVLIYSLAVQPLFWTVQPVYAANGTIPLAGLSAEAFGAGSSSTGKSAGEAGEGTSLADESAVYQASTADELGLAVAVGFADSTSASADFPTPWQGSPNVVFVGAGAPMDAGAIRLDNLSGAPLTVDSVEVDLQRSNAVFSLWPAFTIPAGGSAVLTQTAPGNFDTSAFPLVACGEVLPPGESRIPRITLTAGGGTVTLLDTAHVLDTGGFDASCRGNESL
ncbi:MAG: hypothetical protein KDD47_21655, partial [Acidobacteria bacterium]|nr:hypothetical protein [Acidobacteriota bacterium]